MRRRKSHRKLQLSRHSRGGGGSGQRKRRRSEKRKSRNYKLQLGLLVDAWNVF